MSGKRLLDAAKLLSAARAVAKSHAEIRSEQWDTFSKTSQLAKALKNQTDRFTVTAGAAFELAKRLNETDSPINIKNRKPAPAQPSRPAPTTSDAAINSDIDSKRDLSTGQAHPLDTGASPQLSPRQFEAAQDPLEDGTIPPSKNRLDTPPEDIAALERDESRRAREAQRQSEAQIPFTSAHDGEPSTHQGDDTFSTRDEIASPSLSSLPRVKIPQATATEQGSDEHLRKVTLNQDVFYQPNNSRHDSQTRHEPDTDMLPSSHVPGFSTGGSAAERRRAYEMRMRSAGSAPRNNAWQSVGTALKPESSPMAHAPEEAETLVEDDANLVKAIADDVSSQSTQGESETQHKLHQSSVPSSRFGRIWQYSGLATSMAFGALGEGVRRMTGGGGDAVGSLVLSEANMNRLVAKLSRMRGAALKLGQMMSFQGQSRNSLCCITNAY